MESPIEENTDYEDSSSSEALLKELKELAKTLVTQYNTCVQGTRKILKKVKYAESSNEEILLVPKAPMRRWLTSSGLSEKEVFTVEEFLRLFFSNAAKQNRLEYSTLVIRLTEEEQALFQFKQPVVSYFEFMAQLPVVFA